MSNNIVNSPLGPATFLPYPDSSTFLFAGNQVPGKWTLEGAEKVFGWDIRMGFGLSGAFVVPKGDELVRAKFRGEFWDSGTFFLYQAFRTLWLSKPVIATGPIILAPSISHPELDALGVSAVVVEKIGAVIDQGGGHFTTWIQFLQYRPPAPVVAKPTRATDKIAQPTLVPQSANDLETQALHAEAKRLMSKF